MSEHDSQDDIVIQARETMDAVEKERLAAFARDFTAGKDSSVQSVHWRITYYKNDVAGDKLTIEAILPYHDVQEVMKLLDDAISQIKNESKAK